jgi:ferric-dicitrate binding protein FerR (iron transport regulator)
MNSRKPIQGMSLLIALLVLSIVTSAAAQTVQVSGKITLKQADGTEAPAAGAIAAVPAVTVNGTNAISGATVFSDSTVTTAKGSSAVVSLGKLGRVEVFPDTTVKLTFTNSTITATLEAGRVRVSSSSGVTTTVTTSDGQVVTTGSRINEFTVDVSCGNTFVSVKKGSVELRAGTTVKQIAAGGQDTAGTARPGCTPGGRD